MTTPTNANKWTWSGWVKRGSLGGSQNFFAAGQANTYADFGSLAFSSDQLYIAYDINGTVTWYLLTNQVFRDPSAWYHIVVAYDSTQATAANRVLVYVNGVQVTSFSVATYPTQNTSMYINTARGHAIGNTWLGATIGQYFDGYLAEVNFIDGQALTPTSFGAYNAYGVWSPAKYSGSYGTNGFYLNFQDNSGATATTIGKDSSGNGNNWTPNNISVTAGVTYDSMLDVPTNTSATNANFCTLNPLKSQTAPTAGNLQVSSPTVYGSRATMAVSSGKWYWEVTATTTTSFSLIGVLPATIPLTVDAGFTSSSCSAYYVSGSKILNGAVTAYGSSWTSGDIIGVALDCGANTIQFYKNNVAQGSITLYTSAGTEVQPFVCDENNAGSVFALNFGQRPFSYTPPTGYVALNTYNLPTPTIPNGAAQFAATLYTGNGGTQVITNTVNGVSMQPDLVWIKGRSGATNNGLQDSVRGTAGGILVSNSTAAESAGGAYISSLNTNGFTVNANSSGNGSAATYVGWQWKANGTPAVTNTSGSIPSTISANTTSGFSIVTYTGTGANATVGHGLGVAPSFIIVKCRNTAATGWLTYAKPLTATSFLQLESTAAAASNATAWNNTAPTSTVFTVGTSAFCNGNTQTYVAYCFSEIAGYSKFGSYTGNGSTDGPFVYTGFRPRYVLIKSAGNASQWIVHDTARNTYNVADASLYPNLANAEATPDNPFDILSNGFKIRAGSGVSVNDSGLTYIYAAFAENPFNYSLAR
jgi:hypothetical protein